LVAANGRLAIIRLRHAIDVTTARQAIMIMIMIMITNKNGKEGEKGILPFF
jgi:hypothetical protein